MNILVVHCYHYEYPPRATTWDYLYSFRRYSGHNCYYLNLYFFSVPSYVREMKWDVMIFTDLFVMERWNPQEFKKMVEKARPLKNIDAVKVVVPQDEYIYTDELCNFINEFGIRYVFSNAFETEWKKIYPTVDFDRVRFFTVLTGYLDDKTVDKINMLSKSAGKKTIDIGYRSKKISPALGRHGILKSNVADIFQEKAREKGLTTDISLHPKDTFLGDEWYRFLLRCKYIMGVEGGASILDRDGSIRTRTEEYMKKHPSAMFDEIEAACFPGLDGSFSLFAISPRHMEACATKTCQVLIEGDYNGILVPGKHYIELKRDFSNIDDVLEIMKRDELRGEITENAYRDIVESGDYTYRKFVEFIIQKSLGEVQPCSLPKTRSLAVYGALKLSVLAEFFAWMRLALIRTPIQIAYKLLSVFISERQIFSLIFKIRSISGRKDK